MQDDWCRDGEVRQEDGGNVCYKYIEPEDIWLISNQYQSLSGYALSEKSGSEIIQFLNDQITKAGVGSQWMWSLKRLKKMTLPK